MPGAKSSYVPSWVANGQIDGLELQKLTDDCLNDADPSVNFPDYFGINILFNQPLDRNLTMAGTYTLTKDGVTKQYGVSYLQSGPSRLLAVIYRLLDIVDLRDPGNVRA